VPTEVSIEMKEEYTTFEEEYPRDVWYPALDG